MKTKKKYRHIVHGKFTKSQRNECQWGKQDVTTEEKET